MTTRQAIHILIESGFQIRKKRKVIHLAFLTPKQHSEKDIQKAISIVNKHKYFTIIQKITEENNPIL